MYHAKLYVFSADSIFCLDNRKIKASALPSVLRPVTGFAAGRTKQTGGPLFYTLAHAGIWRSDDLGKTWKLSNKSLAGANVTAIACAEFDAAKAYVVVDRLQDAAKRVWYGVWKTEDQSRQYRPRRYHNLWSAFRSLRSQTHSHELYGHRIPPLIRWRGHVDAIRVRRTGRLGEYLLLGCVRPL